jgi:hypothetical protein
MTVKYRKLLIALGIATLVVLNIWRWWPTSTIQPDKVKGKVSAFSVEDFEVKVAPVDSLQSLTRDIFYPKKIVNKTITVKTKQAVVPLPPVKTQEELVKENAEAEFVKIKCVGISVRNERVHAYVINAGEPALVSKGDKVGSRFVVEKISPDGVTLRDPETGVGGLISISGK